MGLLGPVALILYGMGSNQIGRWGAVIGWPIMSDMGILGANFLGSGYRRMDRYGKETCFDTEFAVQSWPGCLKTLNPRADTGRGENTFSQATRFK